MIYSILRHSLENSFEYLLYFKLHLKQFLAEKVNLKKCLTIGKS